MNSESTKHCKICDTDKPVPDFLKNRLTCKVCYNLIRKEQIKNNPEINAKKLERRRERYNTDEEFRNRRLEQRREKYKNDEEHRKKVIQGRSEYKKAKKAERDALKLAYQIEIGIDNKMCKYCNVIKLKTRFRHNRLKCMDCERDEPTEKFKRYVRTRIYDCLRHKNKDKHSYEYLGCNGKQYLEYILYYNSDYTLDNHGEIWHIDHVIPLSKFDLNDKAQQLIAFNWRNTMPLCAKENLRKKNKIIKTQVDEHFNNLRKYHDANNIELPQEFIDLFCNATKLLEVPIESSLPLIIGNDNEELG